MRFMFAVAFVSVLLAACGKAELSQDCTMNGFGQGRCSFTNKGDAKGSVCGHIVVTHNNGDGTEESSEFCSGEVENKSTKQVDFSVPAVRALCKTQGLDKSWGDVCSFTFVASK